MQEGIFRMTERQRFPRTFDAPAMHRGKMFRHRWILIVGWALMLFGCAAPETIHVTSFDPAQDQLAIAGYYRGEALVMRQRADSN